MQSRSLQRQLDRAARRRPLPEGYRIAIRQAYSFPHIILFLNEKDIADEMISSMDSIWAIRRKDRRLRELAWIDYAGRNA